MGVAPLFAVFVGEAEAGFALHAVGLFHLGGVFTGLEVEQAVGGFRQQLGGVAVQVAKERVFVGLADALAIACRPQHAASVELPAGDTEVGFFFAHQTVAFGSFQQRPDDIRVSRILDVFVVRVASTPGAAFFQVFSQAGTAGADHQVLLQLLAFEAGVVVFLGAAGDEPLGRGGAFVFGEAPGFAQVGETDRAQLIKLGSVQVPRGHTQSLPHEAEQQAKDASTFCGLGRAQHGRCFAPLLFVCGQVSNVLVFDLHQTQLFKVGVVESPASAQVMEGPVAQDGAHGILHLTAAVAFDVGLLHVLGTDTGVVTVKAQGREHGTGNVFFAEVLAGGRFNGRVQG